jgi:hypothetical protein
MGIHTECNRTWESGELKVAWVWANRERRAESDVHTFCMRIEGNVVNGRWQGNARLLWLADVSKEKQVFFATRYGDGLVVG